MDTRRRHPQCTDLRRSFTVPIQSRSSSPFSRALSRWAHRSGRRRHITSGAWQYFYDDAHSLGRGRGTFCIAFFAGASRQCKGRPTLMRLRRHDQADARHLDPTGGGLPSHSRCRAVIASSPSDRQLSPHPTAVFSPTPSTWTLPPCPTALTILSITISRSPHPSTTPEQFGLHAVLSKVNNYHSVIGWHCWLGPHCLVTFECVFAWYWNRPTCLNLSVMYCIFILP